MAFTKRIFVFLICLCSVLSSENSTARPKPTSIGNPWIFLIHGMFYREGMESLKKFYNYNGFHNVTIYGDDESSEVIAKDIYLKRQQGFPSVLIGHSQGGFNVLKVARVVTQQYKERIEVVFSLGAGGLGRLVARQWFQSPRYIPCGIGMYYNFQTTVDIWGTDIGTSLNQAVPESAKCHLNGEEIPSPKVVNRMLDSRFGISHHDLPACFGRSGAAPSKNLLDQVCGPLLITARVFLSECRNKPFPPGCFDIKTPFLSYNPVLAMPHRDPRLQVSPRGPEVKVKELVDRELSHAYRSQSSFPRTTRWYSGSSSSKRIENSYPSGELVNRYRNTQFKKSSLGGSFQSQVKKDCDQKFFTEKYRNQCYELRRDTAVSVRYRPKNLRRETSVPQLRFVSSGSSLSSAPMSLTSSTSVRSGEPSDLLINTFSRGRNNSSLEPMSLGH